MKVYYNDLYTGIFHENTNRYNNVRIISGYSSNTFLEKVMLDFPKINIELYIGMICEGISEENHNKYQAIMKENKNIQIYYQVNGVPNHMKLYDFFNDIDHLMFIGSANFSENGFSNQKEIMGQVIFNANELFEEQKNNSLLCIDKDIDKYISLFEDPNKEKKYSSREDDDELIKDKPQIKKGRRVTINHFLKRYKKDKSFIGNEFNFFIVHSSIADINWDRSGINNWVLKRESTIKQTTTKVEFKELFPLETEFKIYTDDDYTFTAKIGGDFDREIYFKDVDIYNYFKLRIGLKENRPISYEDLKEYNLSSAFFTRISEREYFVEFKNES